MNNLPQYELIGAYLDGELDAAEAAEVEHLLADDPAARQMLDEFRSLGTVLKNSLPRETLPTDLTAQVLAAAERRMLDPDAAESNAPDFTPATPPWPRRLLNPRIWVWSGIAVALALAVTIGERQQRKQPGGEPPRDLARAVDNRHKDQAAAKAESPPTMQAAPEPEADAKQRLAAAPRKGGADALKDTAGMDSPQGAITPPPEQAVRENMAKESLATIQPRTSRGEKAGEGRFSAPAAAPPAPAAPEPLARGTADAHWGTGSYGAPGFTAENNNDVQAGQTPKAVAAPPGVLVVHCTISPRAAKDRAFDKLLTANGISWRHETDGKELFARRDRGGENKSPADGKGEEKSQSKAAKTAPQEKPLAKAAEEALHEKSIAGARKPADAQPDNEAERIYVEATEAQLRAALAGLSAQPEVFLSFSIQRPRAGEDDEKAGDVTHSEAAQSRRMMKLPAGGQSAPPAGAQSPELEELPQAAANVALRRVLFVLRVVEPVEQAEAAKIAPADKSQQSKQSKQAEAAAPPAAEKPSPAQK